MKIYLNQVEVTTEQDATISQLLHSQGIKPEGIAVAINNRIVKRDEWTIQQLAENDKVTVIRATYGG